MLPLTPSPFLGFAPRLPELTTQLLFVLLWLLAGAAQPRLSGKHLLIRFSLHLFFEPLSVFWPIHV